MVTPAATPPVDADQDGLPTHFWFDVDAILAPLRKTSWTFYLAAFPLALITLWGVFALIWQLWYGPGTNGIGRPVYWGIYMVNFVAFTGISMAGVTVLGPFADRARRVAAAVHALRRNDRRGGHRLRHGLGAHRRGTPPTAS